MLPPYKGFLILPLRSRWGHTEETLWIHSNIPTIITFYTNSWSNRVFLGFFLFLCFAETVGDSPRDNQDIMSGEIPADVAPTGATTKELLHHMTEQAFTFDYEDATQGLAVDEEEGNKSVLSPFDV